MDENQRETRGESHFPLHPFFASSVVSTSSSRSKHDLHRSMSLISPPSSPLILIFFPLSLSVYDLPLFSPDLAQASNSHTAHTDCQLAKSH